MIAMVMVIQHWVPFVVLLISVAGVIGFALTKIATKPAPAPSVSADPLRDSLQKGICPDCEGNTWYMGPHGGLSQNIQCATCKSKFCIAPCDDEILGPLIIAQRIAA
jgi:hypothetical protein